MPLLVPLALLATPGAETLRRGAANAWYWFSVMGFTFFILVGWVYWSGLELGVPPRLHAHLHRIAAGLHARASSSLPFVLGRALHGRVVRRARSSCAQDAAAAGLRVGGGRHRHVGARWRRSSSAGSTSGKSYRGMIASMQTALPATYRCMSSRDLGDPQRAMLHYFAGIVTYRRGSRRSAAATAISCSCRACRRTRARRAGNWIKIWEGNRPGDKAGTLPAVPAADSSARRDKCSDLARRPRRAPGNEVHAQFAQRRPVVDGERAARY